MNPTLHRYCICYHRSYGRYRYYSGCGKSCQSGYELYLIFFFSIMFSAKIYIKYPQSTFIEERSDSGEYLGTYSVSLPCSLFLDEELTKEIGSHGITLENLSIDQCNPTYVYGLVMSHFEEATHIV